MSLSRSVPVLLCLSGVALAFSNEPQGFGKARFGMSQEQVKQIFPKMQPAASGPVEGLPMAFYNLEGQTLEGLGPCKLQLRFAGDQLYEITFDCGRDEKVEKMLREKYGPPAQVNPQGAYWFGEKGGITMNPRSRTFAFVDMQINRTVQGALLGAVLKAQGQGTPPSTTPPKQNAEPAAPR